jgi:hypothetical protein
MSYLISSPVVNVDVSILSKTVELPLANTAIGKSFLVRDLTGAAGFPNTINIITSGIDTIDYQTVSIGNPIQLATPYESIRLIAQSTTNYSVLMRSFNNNWPPFG